MAIIDDSFVLSTLYLGIRIGQSLVVLGLLWWTNEQQKDLDYVRREMDKLRVETLRDNYERQFERSHDSQGE